MSLGEVFDPIHPEIFAQSAVPIPPSAALTFNGNNTVIQPTAAQADSAVIMEVTRSAAEATNASLRLLKVENNGTVTAGNTVGPAGTFVAGTTSLSASGVVKSSGTLDLYAGTATNFVNAARGHFKVNSGPTGSRPVAGRLAARWGPCSSIRP